VVWPHFSLICIWCKAKWICLWSDHEGSLETLQSLTRFITHSAQIVIYVTSALIESGKVGYVPLFRICLSVPTTKSSRLSPLESILVHLIPHDGSLHCTPREVLAFYLSHVTSLLTSCGGQSLESWGIYTGCPRRNAQHFRRVFLMLKYTDITQNTYVQSWVVTEIKAREKCGLFAVPRTVPGSCDVIPIRCALSILIYSWLKRVPRCDCTCKVLGNPKDNYDVSASVFVVQFNGFMSLTS